MTARYKCKHKQCSNIGRTHDCWTVMYAHLPGPSAGVRFSSPWFAHITNKLHNEPPRLYPTHVTSWHVARAGLIIAEYWTSWVICHNSSLTPACTPFLPQYAVLCEFAKRKSVKSVTLSAPAKLIIHLRWFSLRSFLRRLCVSKITNGTWGFPYNWIRTLYRMRYTHDTTSLSPKLLWWFMYANVVQLGDNLFSFKQPASSSLLFVPHFDTSEYSSSGPRIEGGTTIRRGW